MTKIKIANNSIAKIWIIILILIGTFAALIYWGARSYKKSATSIQSIVKPDNKSILTNDIFKSVVQSDLHLNNFILTDDSIHKKLSDKYVEKTDSLITALEELLHDKPDQQVQLDSLKRIIDEKDEINQVLIELKKKQKTQFFSEKALGEIKNQISDSAFVDKNVTEKQDLIVSRDTVERVDIVTHPDDYKGISGAWRKIVGKEKVEVDTITSKEEQLDYSIAISVNSEVVRDYFVDTTLMAVKSILIDVLDDEIKMQRKLFYSELGVISANELLLQKIRELLEDISASNYKALRSDQMMAISEVENAHKAAFIIAGVGILLGFVLLLFLIKDITQTDLYRNKLEKEKDRAEKLAAAKETFLSRMSHEIRTPLHSISGFTSLLEKEEMSENQKKYLNGLAYANHYLNELIGNILEQAKINAGTYKLENSKVHIPELGNELEILFKHRQEEKENEFIIEYSPNLKNYDVIIDRIKLKQVLVNLIGNAIKFTSHGTVSTLFTLSENPEGNKLHIEVIDTGIGIDPKYHESIFKTFNQMPGQQNINATGTGLGLSICKQIIESFGGKIGVESELGEGGKFIIDLPVKCEPIVVSNKQEEVEFNDETFFPINVLAVEDDDWNGFLLENYLSPHVKVLKVCKNAEDGLAELKQSPEHYQLILTDLNLPKMGGKELFKAIPPELSIPLIAFSASLSKNDEKDLLAMGFSDAIGKPFSKRDLLASINKLFAQEQVEKAADQHHQTINPNDFQAKTKSNNIDIDLGGVAGFFQGDDTSQLKEYISIFSSSFQSKTIAFQQAIQTNDANELARLCHQLRSNCEQIGVTALSERLQSIEVFTEVGNTARVFEEALVLLPQLEQISVELQNRLSHLS